MMLKNCSVCGKSSKDTDQKLFAVKDGAVCGNCIIDAGYSVNGASKREFISHTVSELADRKAYRKENKEQIQSDFEAQRDAFNASVSDSDLLPKCPKCHSTSISADKKGFGVGKAVVGAAVAGSIGLVAGNIGAKKVRITCLNCGHQWMAGKG